MGARVSQHDLDGIIWTAIRAMMLDTDPEQTAANVECVKSIAHLLTKGERKHQAWDIRQNIEWNNDSFPETYEPSEQIWADLASWLDSDSKHDKKTIRPRYRIHQVWFRFIRYSLRYICHRHTYASSYVLDIAALVPLMSEEQIVELGEWLKDNVQATDDEDIRKFAAAMDIDNRYLVTASATKKQMKKWIERTPNVIHTGNIQAIPEATHTCFLFEGRYCNVDDYFNHPYIQGSVIDDFITKIEKPSK